MRTLNTNKTRRAAPLVAAVLLSGVLAGCKGKADDSTTPAAPSASAPGASMPAASTPGTMPAPGGVGDAATAAKVRSAVIADKAVGANTVKASAAGGVVTLTGTVKTAAAKTAAEADAKHMQGVKSVTSQITVAP